MPAHKYKPTIIDGKPMYKCRGCPDMLEKDFVYRNGNLNRTCNKCAAKYNRKLKRFHANNKSWNKFLKNDAAYAAANDASANASYARIKVLAECADIVRKTITADMIWKAAKKAK